MCPDIFIFNQIKEHFIDYIYVYIRLSIYNLDEMVRSFYLVKIKDIFYDKFIEQHIYISKWEERTKKIILSPSSLIANWLQIIYTLYIASSHIHFSLHHIFAVFSKLFRVSFLSEINIGFFNLSSYLVKLVLKSYKKKNPLFEKVRFYNIYLWKFFVGPIREKNKYFK